MQQLIRYLVLPVMFTVFACPGCGPDDPYCGPESAWVERAVDGDTLVLDSGTRVRILGIDAPESGACFGYEAWERLGELVDGRRVVLESGAECVDRYGRRLARVFVDGFSVARILVDEGLACAFIPGDPDRENRELQEAQQIARALGGGLWGNCSPVPCR
jgi:micrococcal nuclease